MGIRGWDPAWQRVVLGDGVARALRTVGASGFSSLAVAGHQLLLSGNDLARRRAVFLVADLGAGSLAVDGASVPAPLPAGVLPGGGHVKRRVAVEEAAGRDLEAEAVGGHHRVLLGLRVMREAGRVPDHQVVAASGWDGAT